MADEADAAQRIEELQRRVALDAMRRAIATERDAGREDCEDCGGFIPPPRLQAIPGATRCTRCQSIFDHQNRTGR
jgi:phage/conjugal plasmid C-4 type zinc finger TraR family protein